MPGSRFVRFSEAGELLTLADDSGLEIDALNGEPGVYSARYGDTATDDHAARYQIVLEKMKQVAPLQRTARFRCVIALGIKDAIIGTVAGTLEGYIAEEPAGSGGFGYDPIFYLPDRGQTLAQLSAEEKHKISHRGRAAQAAIPLIEAYLSQA